MGIDSLIGKKHFIFCNRESSRKQKKKHVPKNAALTDAHAIIGVSTPFVELNCEERGNVEYLRDFFTIHRSATQLHSTYWGKLKNWIDMGLANVLPGESLHVVFCTLSRLMRPIGFDPRDKTTWTYSIADCDFLERWLIYNFGSRAGNIIFVMLNAVPDGDRACETAVGMYYQNRKGGRKRRLDTRQKRKNFKKKLRREIVRLAGSRKMYAPDIRQIFINSFPEMPFSLRRIQDWMRQEGVERRVGRPPKTAKNTQTCFEKYQAVFGEKCLIFRIKIP